MAYAGYNLRSTLAFVSDAGSGSVFLGGVVFSAPIGYLGSAPSVADRSAALGDVRLAGTHTYGYPNVQLVWNLSNGSYSMVLASGNNGTAQRHEILVWDGQPGINAGNNFTYLPSTAVLLNKLSIVGDKLYKCTTAGTTGAASAPSGTGSAIADNTVVWAWQKTALLHVDSVSSVPGTSVMDATGAIYTYAAWITSNTPSANFNVASGQITIMAGPNGSNGQLRHVAVQQNTAPLQDVTLNYDTGVPVGGTSPTVYANEPAGKVIAQVVAAIGASAPANISFTGALAPYVTAQTVNGVTCIVANATRIPDSMNGASTLGVVQTDPASTVTGSPRTTNFTPTIVSSGGRSVDNGTYLGRMSTETWLKRKIVKDVQLNEWPGYTGQPFATDVAATSMADVQAAIAAITPAANAWYRIRLQNSANWQDSVLYDMGHKDFVTQNGGLLIEPDAGSFPEIKATIYIDGMRGLHWRNSWFSKAGPTGTSTYEVWLNLPTHGIYNIVKFEGCRFGMAWSAGYDPVAQHTDFPFPAFSCFHAEQVITCKNQFSGCRGGISVYGARYWHSSDNDFQHHTDDLHAVARWYRILTPIGVFADENSYCLVERETARHAWDYWNTLTVLDVAHMDWCQVRQVEAKWVTGTVYGANAFCTFYNHVYQTTAGGTSGVTAPTHTAGAVSDGGVTWTFIRTMPGILYLLMESNVCNTSGINYLDWPIGTPTTRYGALMQFYLDSSSGASETQLIALNNIFATPSSYGVGGVYGGCHVEYNCFMSPSVLPPAGAFGSQVLIDAFIAITGDANTPLPRPLLRARKNILGEAAPRTTNADLAFEGNVRVHSTVGAAAPDTPNDRLAGGIAFGGPLFSKGADVDGNRYVYPFLDDQGTNDRQAFMGELRSLLFSQPGLDAGVLPPPLGPPPP